MHTNQTFQSAVYVPEHQADSAAVVGFGWAIFCEAGIVTGEMETVERGPFPCACGFFLRDRPRNPRENVKPRLGYVFVRFLRDQEFREHVKPRLVLGRFFGQDRPPQTCETQAWACFWALSGETDPGIVRNVKLRLWACLEVACWLDFARDPRPPLVARCSSRASSSTSSISTGRFRVWCLLFGFRWVAR